MDFGLARAIHLTIDRNLDRLFLVLYVHWSLLYILHYLVGLYEIL